MRPRHGSYWRRGGPAGGFRASPTGVRPSLLPRPRKSGCSPRVLLGRGLASRSSRPAPSCPLPRGQVLAAPGSLSACPSVLLPPPIGATPPVAAGPPHVRLGPRSAAPGRSARTLAPWKPRRRTCPQSAQARGRLPSSRPESDATAHSRPPLRRSPPPHRTVPPVCSPLGQSPARYPHCPASSPPARWRHTRLPVFPTDPSARPVLSLPSADASQLPARPTRTATLL